MHKKPILIAFLLLIFIQNANAQEIQFDLKGTGIPVLDIAGFELSEVLNFQSDLTLIGKVYTTNNQLYKAKIKNGLTEGIKTFYHNSIKKSDSDRPILLRVLEFKIEEKQQGSKVATGELKIKFSYFLKTSFEPVHLVDYEAGISYKRSIHRTDLVDQILNRGLKNSLVFMNEWINDQANFNKNLAKTVRLEIIEKKVKIDPDTVFYDQNRMLRWDDFRERPSKPSSFNAAIFTSIAIEGSPFMKEGGVIFPIEVKVYMLPESSWVKAQGKNEYSLNHEQKHFDLTRVVGNRLINKLKSLEVTPENYEAEVNEAFFDSYREMNKLQEIYDARTSHGLDKDAQSRWNEIIDQALKGDMEEIEKELIRGK
jgi:hypothetical protein